VFTSTHHVVYVHGPLMRACIDIPLSSCVHWRKVASYQSLPHDMASVRLDGAIQGVLDIQTHPRIIHASVVPVEPREVRLVSESLPHFVLREHFPDVPQPDCLVLSVGYQMLPIPLHQASSIVPQGSKQHRSTRTRKLANKSRVLLVAVLHELGTTPSTICLPPILQCTPENNMDAEIAEI
jgi:hypothetical protein